MTESNHKEGGLPIEQNDAFMCYSLGFFLAGSDIEKSSAMRARQVFQSIAQHVPYTFAAVDGKQVELSTSSMDDFCRIANKKMCNEVIYLMCTKFKTWIARVISNTAADDADGHKFSVIRKHIGIVVESELSFEVALAKINNKASDIRTRLFSPIADSARAYCAISNYYQISFHTAVPPSFLRTLTAAEIEQIKRHNMFGTKKLDPKSTREMSPKEVSTAMAAFKDTLQAYWKHEFGQSEMDFDIREAIVKIPDNVLSTRAEFNSRRNSSTNLYNYNVYNKKFDALRPLALQTLKEQKWAEEAECRHGKNAPRKKKRGKGRLYRCCANGHKTIMSLSKGAYCIPTIDPSPFEDAMIKMSNDMFLAPLYKLFDLHCTVLGYKTNGSKNAKDETVTFHRIWMNFVQVMANGPNAGYGLHDDGEPDNTCGETIFTKALISLLPKKWQQIVITFSFVFKRHEITGELDDVEELLQGIKLKSEICHVRKVDVEEEKAGGSLPAPVSKLVSNFDNHPVTATVQTHMMQTECLHHVVDCETAEDSTEVRVIGSVRVSVPFFDDPEMKEAVKQNFRTMYKTELTDDRIRSESIYRHTNPFDDEKHTIDEASSNLLDDKSCSGEQRGKDIQLTQGATAENVKMGFKYWNKLQPTSESLNDIPTPTTTKSCAKPVSQKLRKYTFVRALQQRGRHLAVRRQTKVWNKDKQEFTKEPVLVHYLNNNFKYGHVTTSQHRRDKGINSTTQHNDICNTKKPFTDEFMPLHTYKNLKGPFVETAVSLFRDRNAAFSMEGCDDTPTHSVGMGPPGGGVNKAGTHSAGQAGDTSSTVIEKLETSKRIDNFPPFVEGLAMKSVVELHIPLRWVYEEWKRRTETQDAKDNDDWSDVMKKYPFKDFDSGTDDRQVFIGYYFFWRIRSMDDKDYSTPGHPTYRDQIFDKNNPLTFWARVEENFIVLLKPLYWKGQPPPKCVTDGTKTVPFIVEENEYAAFVTTRENKNEHLTEDELVMSYLLDKLCGEEPEENAKDKTNQKFDPAPMEMAAEKDAQDGVARSITNDPDGAECAEEGLGNVEDPVIPNSDLAGGRSTSVQVNGKPSHLDEKQRSYDSGASRPEFEFLGIMKGVEKLSIIAALQMIARIGVASFGRFMNENIDEEGNIGYLWKEEWASIGWLLASRSVGHPNRCMNPNTLNLLLFYLWDGKPEGNTDNVDEPMFKRTKNPSTLATMDRLFRASINKFVPAPNIMRLYRRWCTRNAVPIPTLQSDEEKELYNSIPVNARPPAGEDFEDPHYVDRPYIPGPFKEELDHFKKFLLELSTFHLSSSKPHSMAPFVKTLHKAALPDFCSGDIDTFITSMHSFLEVLSDVYFHKSESLPTRRDELIRFLGVQLASSGANMHDCKPEWVMSEVVKDYEEITESHLDAGIDPFLGSGGMRGLEFLEDYSGQSCICTLARKILETMENGASKDILDAFGYYRMNGRNKIFNKINGSPINISHIDHWLCDLSFAESLTTGSRLVSQSITSGLRQPYEWPVGEMWKDLYSTIIVLTAAASSALDAFQNYAKQCRQLSSNQPHELGECMTLPVPPAVRPGLPPGIFCFGPIPEPLKLIGEDTKWPLAVNHIKTWYSNDKRRSQAERKRKLTQLENARRKEERKQQKIRENGMLSRLEGPESAMDADTTQDARDRTNGMGGSVLPV
ncbi:MAG: hypothetical protein SGILL_002304 [Bacillariaceae sp.]